MIQHIGCWQTRPKGCISVDIQETMLQKAESLLATAGVPTRTHLMSRGQALSLADAAVDVIVTFYSLEHIYPLAPYIDEFKRVLKRGGILAGAIPAEGGLAWGGGGW